MLYSYGIPAYRQTFILDRKYGDVNGDGTIDSVWLTGQKTSAEEIYADNISIVIQDGKTNSSMQIPLANAGGYGAQLYLGPFTSKQQLDILVSIDSGGSGGYIFAFLYTIRNNSAVLLLDSDSFNNSSVYDAVFKNNFKVEITSSSSDIRFLIDISSNRKLYIDNGIYNANGKLLEPTVGGVLALGGLFPLVNDYDGLYQLLAYQRIIGINNGNNLGAVQTYLKWDGKKIVTDRVEVAIMPESSS